MSDLERFNEIVDDLWELVFGTVRRPEVKFKNDSSSRAELYATSCEISTSSK